MYYTADFLTAAADRAREDFTRIVEAALQLRRVPFDLRALREFMAAMWPLVIEGEGPSWWADAYLEAHQEAA